MCTRELPIEMTGATDRGRNKVDEGEKPMSARARNGIHARAFEPAIPTVALDELRKTFPIEHFNELFADRFPFYRTTFWHDLDRELGNVFERVVQHLRPLANPSSEVTAVEWWFSVVEINATP